MLFRSESKGKCPLSQFTKAVQPLFIDDFESECESRSYWTTTISTPLQGMCCSIDTLDDDELFEPLESFLQEPDREIHQEKIHDKQEDQKFVVEGLESDSKSSVCCHKNISRLKIQGEVLQSKQILNKCFLAKNTHSSYRICIEN